MSETLTSVIIPTKNRVRDLVRCLDGLNRQTTASSFEVIIVDDHSNISIRDQYLKLIKTYTLTIHFFELDNTEHGAAKARNKAISFAQGQYLAFLDDDAIPEINWIESIVCFFEKHPHVSAVTGWVDAIELSHPLSVFRQTFYNMRYEKICTRQNSLQIADKFGLDLKAEDHFMVDYLAGGNSAVRRNSIEIVGPFDTTFTMMHDKELALRLLVEGSYCVFLPEMRIKHNHTKSLLDAFDKSWKSGEYHFRMQQKYSSYLQENVLNVTKPFISIFKLKQQLKLRLNLFSIYTVLAIIMLDFTHQLSFFISFVKWKMNIRKES